MLMSVAVPVIYVEFFACMALGHLSPLKECDLK